MSDEERVAWVADMRERMRREYNAITDPGRRLALLQLYAGVLQVKPSEVLLFLMNSDRPDISPPTA